MKLIVFYHFLSLIFVFVQSCNDINQIKISEFTSPGVVIKDLRELLLSIDSTNTQFNYYITSHSQYFALKNGQLRLKESIDRELVCSPNDRHQMRINNKCCQGHCCLFIKLESSKKQNYVRVMVEDENDNQPTFQQTVYVKKILENSDVNTKLYLSTAEDDDVGINSIQTYYIEKNNASFDRFFLFKVEQINRIKVPVLIVKNRIDREFISKFEFDLVAKDGGNPTKRGKCKYIVKILDENDNAPKFDKLSYQKNVRENQLINSNLLSFKIVDPDFEENGKIELDFGSNTNRQVLRKFQLYFNRNQGGLRLISLLDYEKVTRYSFIIVAKDRGSPPKSSTASVTINVININDSPPVIEFHQTGRLVSPHIGRIFVDEGDTKDRVLCLVKVRDADSPVDALSCRLENLDEYFYLTEVKTNKLLENRQSYELRSKIDFDRELKDKYYLSITCFDSNNLDRLQSFKKLEIMIRDINDNIPKFTSKSYKGYVKENRANTLLKIDKHYIKAVDNDYGENATIKYSIKSVSNNMGSYFNINFNTGQVMVLQELDYEKIKKITIVICATDNGSPPLSSVVDLIVNVEDLNDNLPVFSTSYYVFEIYENKPKGTLLGKVNFTDDDTEINNKKVLLQITNHQHDLSSDSGEYFDVKKLFRVDSSTGQIYTKMELDREKKEMIMFNLVASNPNPLDQDSRGYFDARYQDASKVTVTVKVLDRNDNSPILVKKDSSDTRNPVRNPEVVFYTQNFFDHQYNDNCINFPYQFIDIDKDEYGIVKVTMKKTKYFMLNMEHGMICIAGDKMPPKGHYQTKITAVDNDPDSNTTNRVDMWLNIYVKDDPNRLKQQGGNSGGYGSGGTIGGGGGSGGADGSYRDENRFGRKDNGAGFSGKNSDSRDTSGGFGFSLSLRSNVLYIIIGSIAAALLLLLIVVLIGFRKFIGFDRNYPSKPSTRSHNVYDDTGECQDLFEANISPKYGEIATLKGKHLYPQYRPDLDCKTMIGSSPSSIDPVRNDLHMMIHGNTSSRPPQQQHNYQTLTNQCSLVTSATGHQPLDYQQPHHSHHSPHLNHHHHQNNVVVYNSTMNLAKDVINNKIDNNNTKNCMSSVIDGECFIDPINLDPANNNNNNSNNSSSNNNNNSSATPPLSHHPQSSASLINTNLNMLKSKKINNKSSSFQSTFV